LKGFFTLLRHVVAIAILPGTVVVVIPLWIVDRSDVRIDWPRTAGNLAFVLLGCVLLAIGGTLFVASVRRFAGVAVAPTPGLDVDVHRHQSDVHSAVGRTTACDEVR
jgi:hypothetical protein